MRQVGIFAAAGLHALEHTGRAWPTTTPTPGCWPSAWRGAGVELDLATVQTNIVVFDLADAPRPDAPWWPPGASAACC